ncbi:LacI family DNA-binding transcriptional regulator [Biostraticola tofi]|uniref:LacI family transcriptional regulator n=1 Tax=Biostraticola tofi TaxID=466109 RepID=A0A4R3YSM8_9GAMM|nr:LacI family DNA-binding transcriptional regulator [Biostraticola tofi]TCV95490.1 LacI family transcriptional regulator [Biostraticola tofi]
MAKTVEQIATALGLSVTTVRLVLSGKAAQYRISAKTQQRIASYVDEFGYSINHTARSLKLNKTDTLGLIIPRLSNIFFATLAEKLEIRCREAGYQLMISCYYNDSPYENQLVDALIHRNVDGLFVVPASLGNQQHHLKTSTRPVILLDRDFATPEVSLVLSDNVHGSERLTEAMLQQAVPPIFFLAGDINQPTIHQRLIGHKRVMERHGLVHPEWVVTGTYNSREDGDLMMRRFIEERGSFPGAFIASSLPVLEGALSVLREKWGVISPEINIGTFDEHPMLGFLSNNIWSVRQNEDAWAEHAVDAMQRLINGEKGPIRHVIPMTLIERRRKASVSG